jgi:hypothetical protein
MEHLHLDLELNGADTIFEGPRRLPATFSLIRTQHQQAAPIKPKMQGSFIPEATVAPVQSGFNNKT